MLNKIKSFYLLFVTICVFVTLGSQISYAVNVQTQEDETVLTSPQEEPFMNSHEYDGVPNSQYVITTKYIEYKKINGKKYYTWREMDEDVKKGNITRDDEPSILAECVPASGEGKNMDMFSASMRPGKTLICGIGEGFTLDMVMPHHSDPDYMYFVYDLLLVTHNKGEKAWTEKDYQTHIASKNSAPVLTPAISMPPMPGMPGELSHITGAGILTGGGSQ